MKLHRNLRTSTILLAIASLMSLPNLYYLSIGLGSVGGNWQSYAWLLIELVTPIVPIATVVWALRGASRQQLMWLHLSSFIAGFGLPFVLPLVEGTSGGGLADTYFLGYGDPLAIAPTLSMWVYLAACITFTASRRFVPVDGAAQVIDSALVSEFEARRRRFRLLGIIFGTLCAAGAFAIPSLVISGFMTGVTYGGNPAQGQTLLTLGSIWGFLEIPFLILGIVFMVIAIQARKSAWNARQGLTAQAPSTAPVYQEEHTEPPASVEPAVRKVAKRESNAAED